MTAFNLLKDNTDTTKRHFLNTEPNHVKNSNGRGQE